MTPFERARTKLRKLGIVLTAAPAEYILSYASCKSQQQVYRAEDLHEAVAIGREMAKNAPEPPDPHPGPLGSPTRARQRAKKIRHNWRVLANRQKKKVAKIERAITSKVKR